MNKHTHIVSDLTQDELKELIGELDTERYFRRKNKGYFANETFIGAGEEGADITNTGEEGADINNTGEEGANIVTWKKRSPSPYF